MSSSWSRPSLRRSGRLERRAGSSTCSMRPISRSTALLIDAQVLGAQAELRELRRGRHDAGVGLRIAFDAADLAAVDELVVLELVQQGDVRAGELQDLLGGVLAAFARR